MKRSAAALVIMIVAGIAGYFAGAFLGSAFGGAILFSLIAGLACIVEAIDAGNPKDED